MNHYYLARGLFRGLHKPHIASLFIAAMALFMVQQASTLGANAASTEARETLNTRFLIGVPKGSTFQVYSLSNPNRVVVDLPNVNIRLPSQPKNGPIGLVKSFSAGTAGEKRSLVIINVTKPVVVGKAAIERVKGAMGYFLALEIEPVKKAPRKKASSFNFEKPYGLGAAGVQPPLPRRALTPKERAAKMAKPTIVIDPGHGGVDTGAKKNGVVEKNVVLAFAIVLRDRLKATGRYNVLMTRSNDTFISLGGRVKFAERHKANLFIAVHADYARSKASGATVYSLRGRTAKALERSAKRRAAKSVDISSDNFSASPAKGSDRSIVRGFLADLARRDVDITRERTNEFTRSVVTYMGDSTALRHSPHKTAGFKVLKTAQFPSVLIELAYVTNKRDAKNLSSVVWREKVSDSLVTAVDDYFATEIANLPM